MLPATSALWALGPTLPVISAWTPCVATVIAACYSGSARCLHVDRVVVRLPLAGLRIGDDDVPDRIADRWIDSMLSLCALMATFMTSPSLASDRRPVSPNRTNRPSWLCSSAAPWLTSAGGRFERFAVMDAQTGGDVGDGAWSPRRARVHPPRRRPQSPAEAGRSAITSADGVNSRPARRGSLRRTGVANYSAGGRTAVFSWMRSGGMAARPRAASPDVTPRHAGEAP